MLETTREYARDCLTGSTDCDEIAMRHARYYQNLIALAGDPAADERGKEWLDLVATEHDNVRAALSWLLSTQDVPSAVQLVLTVYRFWTVRGLVPEGRSWTQRLLGLPGVTSAVQYPALLNAAGEFRRLQGDFQAARRLNQEAAEILEKAGRTSELAEVLYRLGTIRLEEGDREQARILLEKSLSISRAGERPARISRALNGLTVWAMRGGEYAQAVTYAREEVKLAEPVGGLFVAAALHNLGEALRMNGQLGEASGPYKRALQLTAGSGHVMGTSHCLEGIANLAAASGDFVHAAQLWGASGRLLAEAQERRFDPAEVERWIASAKATMGEDAFRAAWRSGEEMSMEQAKSAAVALRESGPD